MTHLSPWKIHRDKTRAPPGQQRRHNMVVTSPRLHVADATQIYYPSLNAFSESRLLFPTVSATSPRRCLIGVSSSKAQNAPFPLFIPLPPSCPGEEITPVCRGTQLIKQESPDLNHKSLTLVRAFNPTHHPLWASRTKEHILMCPDPAQA